VGKLLSGGNVHFSFTDLSDSSNSIDPKNDLSIIKFDPTTTNEAELQDISKYIRKHNIECVLGFDQPPGRKYFKYIRQAGVKHIISYWGASMSNINSGLKLALKRLEMHFRRYSPDHYIFESKAMQDSAIFGRGIDKNKTSITYLGVDTDKFKPNTEPTKYTYKEFRIPENRNILF